MKRPVALMFAFIYFVFITASLWQVEAIEGSLHLDDNAVQSHTFNSAGHEWQYQGDDVYATGFITKVPKHTQAFGKRKAPRANALDLSVKNYQLKVNAVHQFASVPFISAFLYKAPIFIKNRVLRI